MTAETRTDIWASAITRHALVDPKTLTPYPGNPRRHSVSQDDALAGSLDELGWIDEITVNETTGHVTDGHERLALAIARDLAEVPVRYVRLTEDQERKALLYKDAIGAMATYDPVDLQALLDSTATENDALRSLLAQMADDVSLASLLPLAPLAPEDTGAYDERDFWPKLTIQVPRVVLVAWEAAIASDEPHVVLARLLNVELPA